MEKVERNQQCDLFWLSTEALSNRQMSWQWPFVLICMMLFRAVVHRTDGHKPMALDSGN